MNGNHRIEGVQVLLTTPMLEDGSLDWASTEALIEHVIAGGVNGIILLGSTGEFFSLTESERREFIRFAIKAIDGRVNAGVCPGTPGTQTAIALARDGEAAGADYLLVPIPFYFANTLHGIVDFYTRVAHSVSIPVMPYDGGGGYALDMEVWRRIVAAADNISLAKITIPLPTKIKWLHDEFGGRISAFGGSDSTILLALANGARGLTVAGANVVPHQFARLVELYGQGEGRQARCLYYQKISPMNVISVPVHTEFIQCYKEALYWMGVIATPQTRQPLMPLDPARQEELRGALEVMEVDLVR